MRVVSLITLTLSISLMGRAMVILDDCGFSMSKGNLSHNCEGFYSTRTPFSVQVWACDQVNPTIYTTVIEVFQSTCRTILVGYMAPEPVGTTVLYPYILWPIIVLVALAGAVLASWSHIAHKVDKAPESKIKIKISGISINGPEECRDLRWKQLILLVLCWTPANTLCVPPTHMVELKTAWNYKFSLRQGELACFDEGTVAHELNRDSFELEHLYATRMWSKFIWSERKCGYGECGTEDECSVWGKNGKVVHRATMMYKKICKPHTRNFFKCPMFWGCWLATLEVGWKDYEDDVFEVFRVGAPQSSDEFITHGLPDCEVSHVNPDPISLAGMALVVQGDEAWLCDEASKPGHPSHGMIGDIQVLGPEESDVEFDFNAFTCEFDEVESSGGCLVQEPALKSTLGNCLKLPSLMSLGWLMWVNSSLVLSDGSHREFDIKCSSKVSLKEAPHDCYDVAIEHHGVSSSEHLQFLVMRASSHNPSSVLVFNSSCGDEPIVLPCNGKNYSHAITKSDYQSCFLTLPVIKNLTTKLALDPYMWDSGNHSHTVKSKYLYWILVAVCLMVAFRLLRCLICHK
uniref:Glycoprotein n=1 Tax=Evros bunya-like virus TaxID=2805760 RepID=A0A889INV2_9VIRU|nr:MAG: glycoprotein [Evros bunya-like virus]